MPDTPSLKVDKTFTWKGTTRTWSNRYHFNGGTPADSAHWTTFANLVNAAEAAQYTSNSTIQIVKITGYAAGSDLPVFVKTYTQPGLASWAVTDLSPGECACLVRYATTARTNKNHPVYLFNFYHGVCNQGSANVDSVLTAEVTAKQAYANAWITGFSDGTNTYVRAGPHGATAVGALVNTKITHRDFPH
jgi:hypothetical protein